MSSKTISLAEFALLKGVGRMTVHRWAQAGKLGPVTMRPGATSKGLRLDVAELIARGLLELDPKVTEAAATGLKLTIDFLCAHARVVFRDDPKREFRFLHDLFRVVELLP